MFSTTSTTQKAKGLTSIGDIIASRYPHGAEDYKAKSLYFNLRPRQLVLVRVKRNHTDRS